MDSIVEECNFMAYNGAWLPEYIIALLKQYPDKANKIMREYNLPMLTGICTKCNYRTNGDQLSMLDHVSSYKHKNRVLKDIH